MIDGGTIHGAIPQPIAHQAFASDENARGLRILHYRRTQNAEEERNQGWSQPGSGDPRPAFISSLCEALAEGGSIVVYNQQFESQRLWELAGWLPSLICSLKVLASSSTEGKKNLSESS
jgi:hypothetical protein